MKPLDLTAPPLPDQVEDRRVLTLFHRLRPYGGMLSDDELQCLHIGNQTQMALGIALMNRELMAIKWRHRLWLPVFQFNLKTWQVEPNVSVAVTELFPVMQGFDLIEWFLTPNAWLEDQRPVDVPETERQRVQQAAQVERFLLSF